MADIRIGNSYLCRLPTLNYRVDALVSINCSRASM